MKKYITPIAIITAVNALDIVAASPLQFRTSDDGLGDIISWDERQT